MEDEEDVSDPQQHLKKQPSKFGMMMKGMSRSAKKGMSRAGKQMAKGVVKTKMYAIEKIAKAEKSAEDPEIVSALERLKITKSEIYALSDIVRNLYEARLNEATFLVQLADKLCAVRVSQNDPFGSYVSSMGQGLSQLESVQTEHLRKMEEQLVLPLEKFRDEDVEKVQKLKFQYYKRKADFDLVCKRVQKAEETQDQAKIEQAQAKKDSVFAELQTLRNEVKFEVNNLEQKKQVNLLGFMEQYWASYSSFASAQTSILSKNSIEKMPYSPPSNYIDEMKMHSNNNNDTNDNNDNDHMEYGSANDDNDNIALEAGPGVQQNHTTTTNGGDSNALPPPNFMDDDNNGNTANGYGNENGNYDNDQYEDEDLSDDNNAPTDDYNPFDDGN